MDKMCMLEENKICDNCLDCNYCDLKPGKVCDNCAKCIGSDAAYRAIEIDDIIISEDLKRAEDLKRKFKFFQGRLGSTDQ